MPAISPNSDEEVKLINGQMPDSVEEYRVAKALWKLKLDFDFQWIPPVYIARQRGSTVVDFLVKVPPRPVPLFIDGERWHRGPQEQQDDLVRQQMYIALAGRVAKPVAIPAGQLKDQVAADAQMRLLFGGR